MISVPKTEYWRPLVPNNECVDKTTNLFFKNYSDPSSAEDETEFVLFKNNFSIRFSIPAFK